MQNLSFVLCLKRCGARLHHICYCKAISLTMLSPAILNLHNCLCLLLWDFCLCTVCIRFQSQQMNKI